MTSQQEKQVLLAGLLNGRLQRHDASEIDENVISGCGGWAISRKKPFSLKYPDIEWGYVEYLYYLNRKPQWKRTGTGASLYFDVAATAHDVCKATEIEEEGEG